MLYIDSRREREEMLTVEEKIRIIVKRKGRSLAWLARQTGQTPQNLNDKFRRSNFTVAQLEGVAKALGCELEIRFTDKESGESV